MRNVERSGKRKEKGNTLVPKVAKFKLLALSHLKKKKRYRLIVSRSVERIAREDLPKRIVDFSRDDREASSRPFHAL